MSKGLGTMQRAILAALEMAQGVTLPWGTPPLYCEPAPAAPCVRVWHVSEIQACVARLRGTWCTGEQRPAAPPPQACRLRMYRYRRRRRGIPL
jgi:hypothetical protein